MPDRWFYVEHGQRKGPVSRDQLQQLARSGRLKPYDLVWTRGMKSWTPASEVADLLEAEDEPPPIPAPEPTIRFQFSPIEPQRVVMTDDGPVPVDEYSPTWNFIKRQMRDIGLGYMLDTREKRKRCAKQVGTMVGLGAGTIGYGLLKRLGILP